MESMSSNKISIITVCYNCYTDLEKTIKSVLSQTYDNKEYLINELDIIIKNLSEYRDALVNDDPATMKELLAEGRKIKEEVDG